VAVGTADVNVYGENKRIITEIISKDFGTVGKLYMNTKKSSGLILLFLVYVSIGATMVGSIVLTTHAGQPVKKCAFSPLLYTPIRVSNTLLSFIVEEMSMDTLHLEVRRLLCCSREAPFNSMKI